MRQGQSCKELHSFLLVVRCCRKICQCVAGWKICQSRHVRYPGSRLLHHQGLFTLDLKGGQFQWYCLANLALHD
eukprot:scaffold6023_cov150-Skeletonema_marinoi.AAC.2